MGSLWEIVPNSSLQFVCFSALTPGKLVAPQRRAGCRKKDAQGCP